MRRSNGVAGDHQHHSFHLASGPHVTQDEGEIWRELLVLQ